MPHVGFEDLGDASEDFVAGVVALFFVEPTEVVDVNHDDAEGFAVAFGGLDGFGDEFLKRAVVGDASERVEEGEGFNFLKEHGAVEGEGEVFGDGEVKLIGFEEIKVVLFAHHFEDANGFLTGAEGHCSDRPGGEVAVFEFEVCGVGVLVGAFDPDRFAGGGDMFGEESRTALELEVGQEAAAFAVDASVGDEFHHVVFVAVRPEHDGGEVEGALDGVRGHEGQGLEGLVHGQGFTDSAEGFDFTLRVAQGEIGFAELLDEEGEDDDDISAFSGDAVGLVESEGSGAFFGSAADEFLDAGVGGIEEFGGDAPGRLKFSDK